MCVKRKPKKKLSKKLRGGKIQHFPRFLSIFPPPAMPSTSSSQSAFERMSVLYPFSASTDLPPPLVSNGPRCVSVHPVPNGLQHWLVQCPLSAASLSRHPASPSQTLSHAPLTAPTAVGQQLPRLQCRLRRKAGRDSASHALARPHHLPKQPPNPLHDQQASSPVKRHVDGEGLRQRMRTFGSEALVNGSSVAAIEIPETRKR